MENILDQIMLSLSNQNLTMIFYLTIIKFIVIFNICFYYNKKINKLKFKIKLINNKIKKKKIPVDDLIDSIKYLNSEETNMILIACSNNDYFIPNWYSKQELKNLMNISDENFKKIEFDYKLSNYIEKKIIKWHDNVYFDKSIDSASDSDFSNKSKDSESDSDSDQSNQSDQSKESDNNSDQSYNNISENYDIVSDNEDIEENNESEEENNESEENNEPEEENKLDDKNSDYNQDSIDNNQDSNDDDQNNSENLNEYNENLIDDIIEYVKICPINNILSILDECSVRVLIPVWFSREMLIDTENLIITQKDWQKILNNNEINHVCYDIFMSWINKYLNK